MTQPNQIMYILLRTAWVSTYTCVLLPSIKPVEINEQSCYSLHIYAHCLTITGMVTLQTALLSGQMLQSAFLIVCFTYGRLAAL